MSGAARLPASVHDGFVLTPAQRRRRSLYFGDHLPEVDPSMAVTAPLLDRPVVAVWLQRELQSLLLQQDVKLVLQHVMGCLKQAMKPLAQRQRASQASGPAREAVSAATAQSVVDGAAAPYLGEFHVQFAAEFVEFVVSGLNVEAHDALAFHIEHAPSGSESPHGSGGVDEAGIPPKSPPGAS